MTRALVIGRRHKGRPIAALIQQTRDRLEAEGWEVDDALVDEKKQLRRRVAKAIKHGADVVVAVGGDGVVLQVVQELADTSIALGIVPAGTGNLLAGNLDIPMDQQKAIALVLEGRRRRIDLGRLEIGGKERVFSVACGIGFDAEVMKATSKSQKLGWGKLA
jgi:diacylglycerol kinase (ATP)